MGRARQGARPFQNVTIKDGANATVSFNAETAQGVKLAGTIDCKKVTRAQ